MIHCIQGSTIQWTTDILSQMMEVTTLELHIQVLQKKEIIQEFCIQQILCPSKVKMKNVVVVFIAIH